MKYTSILVLAILLFACDSEQPQPELKLIPEIFVEGDFTKSFVYNNTGQLTQIKMISKYPGNVTMESVQDFVYHPNGQLKESTTDTGWRFVYFFSGDHIIKTEEYVTGVLSQVHTYTYNDEGRLTESITWQDIPEEGGQIPVAKDTYEYDQNDNLVFQKLYYYTPFGAEAKLLTKFTFSDYDNKINSEDRFDVIAFNPLLVFRKNNPGKMIVENANGIVGSTEIYTYEYHADGYATKKTASVTLPTNPQTGSYTSTYKFKE